MSSSGDKHLPSCVKSGSRAQLSSQQLTLQVSVDSETNLTIGWGAWLESELHFDNVKWTFDQLVSLNIEDP